MTALAWVGVGIGIALLVAGGLVALAVAIGGVLVKEDEERAAAKRKNGAPRWILTPPAGPLTPRR